MLQKRTIGDKIKYYRKKSGYTSQESLAMAMPDMNRSNVAQYENGNRLPTLEFTDQFCKLCTISKDELLSNHTVEDIERLRQLSPENRLNELLDKLIKEENKDSRSSVVHEVRSIVFELQNKIIKLQDLQLAMATKIREEL